MTSSAVHVPRNPFAGVPLNEVVRDVLAAVLIAVGLSLPWNVGNAAGSLRIEVMLAAVVALVALALPYAQRAGLIKSLPLSESLIRLIGAAPLVIVAFIYLVFDAIFYDDNAAFLAGRYGIGIGLGLLLAGALLLTAPTAVIAWKHTPFALAIISAVTAVLSIVRAIMRPDVSGWGVVAFVITALAAIAFLWLTVWRFDTGDDAAGLLLIGVGGLVALGAVFFGVRWVEAVSMIPWIGYVLWPALAACALPRVQRLFDGTGGRPQLWTSAANLAMAVLGAVGALIAIMALLEQFDNSAAAELVTFRVILGVIIAALGFYGWWTLRDHPATGQRTDLLIAVLTLVAGIALTAVTARWTTAVSPLHYLAVALPLLVLGLLAVPRSVVALRGTGDAADAAALAGGFGGGSAGAGRFVAPVADPAPAFSFAPVGSEAADSDQPVYEPISTDELIATEPVPDEPLTDEAAPELPASSSTAALPPTVTAAETTIVDPAALAETSSADTPLTNAAQKAAEKKTAKQAAKKAVVDEAEETDSRWTKAFALDPKTSGQDLMQLVQDAPHLRKFVAANPSTYEALLDWLGTLGDPEVDKALRTRGWKP